MALIKCDECGRSISSRGDVCPHCGCYTQRKVKTDTCCMGWLIGVVVAVPITLWILFNGGCNG